MQVKQRSGTSIAVVDGPKNGQNGMKKGLPENTENPARGASRVRTGDPLLAKQMRYQLRHSPVVHCPKAYSSMS
jgi:hypothetical protein